jgi:hypothetical protein
VLPRPCLVARHLTFPACILSFFCNQPGWPSGTEAASAVVLRRALNETAIPGNKVVVMMFAHTNPVTGKHEEDASPLGGVSLWIGKFQVIFRSFQINVASAL